MSKKVIAAMSGGVDSSVAAALLKENGYSVSGITLKLFENEDVGLDGINHPCCSLADSEDAHSVAARLGFEHRVLNLSREFRHDVIKRFAEGYKNGITPNPCIDCNKYIKFGKLLDCAVSHGYDYVATGHYAKIEFDPRRSRYLLKRSADPLKDQTYVLYSMTQKQLAHTLFPLGNMHKSEVRSYALRHGFINAEKHDSQDICFVKKGGYTDFLENVMGISSPPGSFIDKTGQTVGKHKGIIHYTIGQRKGLGLNAGRPEYVIKKDASANTVTVGGKDELLCKKMSVVDFNLISMESITKPLKVSVKTRYRQKETSATIYPPEYGKSITVKFENPQPAVAPGQAAVFYNGDTVLGGGTIFKVIC